MNWSFSRLEAARCPLRYRLKYLDGLPEPSSLPANRGSAVHDLLKQYGTRCLKQGLAEDREFAEELADLEGDAIAALVAEYGEGPVGEAAAIFEAFVEQSLLFDPAAMLYTNPEECVEVWFERELPDDLGTFRGRVDVVERQETTEGERLAVTDWKTGWPGHKPTRCPEQLRTYAWLIEGTYPPGESRRYLLRLEYLCLGARAVSQEWSIARTGSIGRQLANRVRSVAALTEFEPQPGEWCQWCGFILDCPLSKAVPGALGRVEDEAEALRLLSLQEQAKALSEAVTRRVNTYARNHWAIKAPDGRKYGAKVVSTWHCEDAQGILQAAWTAGREEELLEDKDFILNPRRKNEVRQLSEELGMPPETWREETKTECGWEG